MSVKSRPSAAQKRHAVAARAARAGAASGSKSGAPERGRRRAASGQGEAAHGARGASGEATAAAPEVLRKVPLQDRSRQRVERILDAAAEVFARDGYEAATTEAIATRAGTSIGSLYQFFPNKLAVFHALAQRYHARVRELYDQLVPADALALPWPELLDRTIDAFYRFHRDDPGFRAVWLSFMFTGELIAAGEALNREFAARTEQVLSRQVPRMPPARRQLVATMIVEVISAMLVLAARRPSTESDAVIAETKVLMRRYLRPYERRPAG